jgi:hypothetical protein
MVELWEFCEAVKVELEVSICGNTLINELRVSKPFATA